MKLRCTAKVVDAKRESTRLRGRRETFQEIDRTERLETAREPDKKERASS